MKDAKYNYIVPVQIRFNDIDGQQHVNNAVYQSYFDLGRVGYFTVISGKSYKTGGRSVVIASVKTDFIEPIFLHDSIQIETRIQKIGTKSLTMLQRITETETGEVKATCSTVFVGFDYEKQQAIELSHELRTMIRTFEKDMKL